ncbi:MAG TPA: hypothetical protein VMH40_13920 [Myxococcaceae bacterium]|nr:hypothetical protein [Myxococcaceae bacterium]
MSERLNDLPPGWDDLGREDAEALGPPRGAKERVQRRVALTLGLGAGFLAATAASSTAAAASAASAASAGTAGAAGGASGSSGAAASGLLGGLLAKKALVLGVAAAVGVGGGTAAYLEVRSERAKTQAHVVAPPAPAPIAQPAAPPLVEPAPAPEPAPVDTLGEERELLDHARQDIARGNLGEARSLLRLHAERFTTGRLSEEREALIIRLLVREGRESEARARAVRFRQQHPRSIQLPGIAEALRSHR